MVDTEFHPDARDNAARCLDRALAADQPFNGGETQGARDWRRRADVGWAGVPVGGHFSNREAHLDFVIYALQRRPRPSDSGRVLCADRLEGLASLVVPAPRYRREFDRDLRDELDHRALCHVRTGAPPRARAVCGEGPAVRTGAPWHGHAGRVLADSLLDVSKKDLF